MDIEIYPATIINAHFKDINPPKHKYCICINKEKRWFFLINSENRKRYQCTPIYKKNQSFLKYDSYISCNAFFQLDEEILSNVKKHLGVLSNNEIKELISHINNNVRTLSKSDKKEICECLSRAIK